MPYDNLKEIFEEYKDLDEGLVRKLAKKHNLIEIYEEIKMNDTSPEMQQKMNELIMKKTPQERLEMSFSMNAFAREIVTASL